MILLLLTLAYMAAIGWALGFPVRTLVRRLSGTTESNPWPWDVQVLAGLLLAQTLLSGLSLVVALGTWAAAPLAGAALLTAWAYRGELKEAWQQLRADLVALRAWQWSLLSITAIALLLTALQDSANYDTGHYHIQALRWLMLAPRVPGLANLDPTFAYGLSTYPLAAVVAAPEFAGHLVFPVGTLMLLLLCYRLAVEIGARTGPLRVVWVVSWVAALSNYLQFVPGVGSDLAVAVCTWYGLIGCLDTDLRARLGGLRGVAAFCVLCVPAMLAQKLSAAPLALLLLWGLWHLRTHWSRVLPWALAAWLLVALPYLARNVIQTGYPLFPIATLDLFDVDWKLPADRLAHAQSIIRGWNRDPHGNAFLTAQLPLTQWFPRWWGRQQDLHKALMILTLVGPFAAALVRLLRRRAGASEGTTAAVGLGCALALVFYLLSAPNPRFFHAYIAVGAVLTLSLLIGDRYPRQRWLSLVLLAAPILFTLLTALPLLGRAPTWDWSGRIWAQPSVQSIELESFTQCDSRYSRPRQPGQIQCWDAPLPCVVNLDPRVELRGPTLEQGFRSRVDSCVDSTAHH